MRIGDAARVAITTFGEDGHRTTSDEFVVRLDDDRVGIWTHDTRRWVDRLAFSPIVSVQAADSGGRPVQAEPVLEGRAELVTEGPDAEDTHTLTQSKYGFGEQLARAVDWAWELGAAKSPDGAVIVHIVG